MLEEALGARRRRRGAVLPGARALADDQRAAAVGAGAIEQRRPRGEVVDHGGPQAAVERGGDGQLVAGVDVELVGERRGAMGRAGVMAQELVDGGELAADSRGLPARRLHGALGVAHLAANPFRGGLGLPRARSAPRQRPRSARRRAGRRRPAAPRARRAGARARPRGRDPARPATPPGPRSAPRPRGRPGRRRLRRPARPRSPDSGPAGPRQRRRRRAPTRRGSRSARRRPGPRRRAARAPRAGRCARPAPPRRPRAAWPRPRARPGARAGARAPRAVTASAETMAARWARTSSRASSQRISSDWRSSRSCSSAASAWRLSGRSRDRASRSTSSARSRLSWVRASLSWARRRRLRCLPSPAASSMSRRRSRGLEVTSDSTRPCEMTECISLPSPVSDSSSTTSTRRQRAPARRYSPSPARSSRRWIEISGTPRPRLPSLSSRTSSTSAWPAACRPGAPPKMTSCIDWPRTAPGDCSPSAHRTASVTLDLPEPLGPTITLTPGPNSSLVRSGKDLKPLTVIDFRYTPPPVGPAGPSAITRPHLAMASSADCAASCSASFLERPTPSRSPCRGSWPAR